MHITKIAKTDNIASRIAGICISLVKNPSDSALIKSEMLEMESLILNGKLSQKEENAILSQKEVKQALPTLQHFYEVFETNLENEFVNELLKGRKKLGDYLLYNRFVELIKNEKNLAEISEKDSVLFIGSGPLPITAILLSMFARCRVDCYDKDRTFAGISRKVIEKLSLSDKIKVYNKKGENLSEDCYSVIVIALLARPKAEILHKVWDKSIKGTRIICRTSGGVRKAFYEQTAPCLFIKYSYVNKVLAKQDQTISSVLLIR